ncbi:MAG: 30S ribosome-binding factor RbfA [Eubacteriales bacterium]|nr:30S ribosome-binding factor RbfA [Eubacteriales bacterium]
MQVSGRTNRIAAEIKKELGDIILNHVKDPRIPALLSVVAVDLSRDYSHVKVYISLMGTDEEKKNALEGIKSAAGFIRRELGQRIKIRVTPELHFELDNSIEYGIYMSNLIDRTLRGNDN